MFIRVYAILGSIFCVKNVPRSSRLVLGCPEPQLDWVQNRGCSDVPSRLKGIETMSRIRTRGRLFPRSDVPSRLKGIETLIPAQFSDKIGLFRCAFPFEGN